MQRRTFLKSSLGVGVGLLAPLSGCSDEVVPVLPENEGVEFGAVQKGPYVQLVDAKTALLRFETILDIETPVVIRRASGEERVVPQRDAREITYRKKPLGRHNDWPDVAGLHVLHEVRLENLTPGETVTYTIEQKAGEPIDASFLVPVPASEGFRFGWIADTMFPYMRDPVAALVAAKPDMVMHGGDLTYDPSPSDSWNAFMQTFQPLFESATTHCVVGNHEFESMEEIDQQYDRLFSGQGGTQGSQRYYAFTFGCVRFVVIDSEEEGISDENSAQIKWLDAELAASKANADIRCIVAAFHRPIYTLSRYWPEDLTVRNLLHTRFKDAGVKLVLCGHAHLFEHFTVDAIHYIVDGGGGAILYDPEERRDKVEAARPGEGDLRLTGIRGYGAVTVDFRSDGGFKLRRLNGKSGEEEYSFDQA